MSQGPNLLIQQGAKLVTSGRDILEEYWDRFPAKLSPGRAPQPGGGRRPAGDSGLSGPCPGRRRRRHGRERIPAAEQQDRFTDDELADRRLGRPAPLRRRAGGGRTDPAGRSLP